MLYASAFFHELGQALLRRWAGVRVTPFGLGTGRPFWVASWAGMRVYRARSRPLQGVTFLFTPQLHSSRRPLLLCLAGGILAQFLLLRGQLPQNPPRGSARVTGRYRPFPPLSTS